MPWGSGIQGADVVLSSTGMGSHYWYIEYLNMIGQERGSQSYAMLRASKKESGCDDVVSEDYCRLGDMGRQSTGDWSVVSNLKV